MAGRALGILIAALALAAPAQAVERGGKVTYLTTGDVDYLDPGITYYSFGFAVQYAINRPLYSVVPGSQDPVPDLAAGPAAVSEDRRTVTVRLRKGVRYAPPVNREVVADDVRYAFERGFTRSVANGYVLTYFGDLEGAPRRYVDRVPSFSGIRTPDDHTLVFRLRKPVATRFVSALILPLTAPVPRSYARRFDRDTPSRYNFHVAASGPYRVASYRRDRSLRLVRNPNWRPASDHRPAYLDAIRFDMSVDDIARAARRTVRGRQLLCCDGHSDRVKPTATVGTGGTSWVALNTAVAPLNRLAVRRAIVAAVDRRALAREYGAPVARHFLPPGTPGFAESDFELDFLRRPGGNQRLARRYLRRAGVRPRRVRPLTIVGDSSDPDRSTAKAIDRTLRRLGFRTRLRLVRRDVMFTRYCNLPASRTAVCPNVGWTKDFNDPESVLRPTFHSSEILTRGNVNWSQLRVPAIDRAMDAASKLAPGPARDRAWAAVNRDITAQAAGIPLVWGRRGHYASKDLAARINPYTTSWDLSYTGLKG